MYGVRDTHSTVIVRCGSYKVVEYEDKGRMTIIIILLIIALCGFTWSLIRVASEADRIERSIWEEDKDDA